MQIYIFRSTRRKREKESERERERGKEIPDKPQKKSSIIKCRSEREKQLYRRAKKEAGRQREKRNIKENKAWCSDTLKKIFV